MKMILIGSVYTDFGETNQMWLDLQTQALDAGAGYEYKLLSYVQQDTGDYKDFFADKTDIIHIAGCGTANNHAQMVRQHKSGKRAIVEYWRQHADEYDHFIFLDSDAFPVNKNWYKILSKHKAASIRRSENFDDTIFHPSFVMMNKKSMEQFEHLEQDDVFQLLRSNKMNIHPMLCGVYYDCIYHHGCGSRSAWFRTVKYWNFAMKQIDNKKLIDNLIANPGKFLRRMMWKKRDCVYN